MTFRYFVLLVSVVGLAENALSEVDESGNWRDRAKVHEEIQVKVRCDQSVGELQKLMAKVEKECDASLNFEITCSKQKLIEGSFSSKWCKPLDPKLKQAKAGCLKVLKLSDAPGNPSVCVEAPGVYYEMRDESDGTSNKLIEQASKSLVESFEAIGCAMDGNPVAYLLWPGSKKSHPVVGFKISSKNCYLLPRVVDASDSKPTCSNNYETVPLYPVLDSKDAKVSRNVCRLKGASGARADHAVKH